MQITVGKKERKKEHKRDSNSYESVFLPNKTLAIYDRTLLTRQSKNQKRVFLLPAASLPTSQSLCSDSGGYGDENGRQLLLYCGFSSEGFGAIGIATVGFRT